MKIVQQFATGSACYKSGGKITVKGLMLHSVGCDQPRASVFASQWTRSNDVCCHACIDGLTDGYVIQTLPWDMFGWHCGDKANGTHIGVEMAEPDTIRYTYRANWVETGDGKRTKEIVMRTYNTAVELFAELCRKYNLDPLKDGVIISHNEGYKRGVASGHEDPEHIWKHFGLTMDGFRKAVKAKMTTGTTSTTTNTSSNTTTSNAASKSKTVELDANTKVYPTVGGAAKGTVGQKGVYTITEEKVYNGTTYGKLKSGIGWVILAYPKTKTVSLDGAVKVYPTVGGPAKGTVGQKGVYTITEEKTYNGATYGKLKSGIGWVIISAPKNDTTIKVGDKVKVLNAVQYDNGKSFAVYADKYTVLEISGNRVVISSDGKNVTAAIDKKNLKKV